MSKFITSSIVIQANPTKVWETLMNFINYPKWNSFIISINGDPCVGKQLSVTMQLPNKKPMIFKPIITQLISNQKFSWKGNLLIKGIFDGFHQFELINNGDGTTTFIQKEEFSGILIPFMTKLIEKDTLYAFEKMNLALKNYIEEEL